MHKPVIKNINYKDTSINQSIYPYIYIYMTLLLGDIQSHISLQIIAGIAHLHSGMHIQLSRIINIFGEEPSIHQPFQGTFSFRYRSHI